MRCTVVAFRDGFQISCTGGVLALQHFPCVEHVTVGTPVLCSCGWPSFPYPVVAAAADPIQHTRDADVSPLLAENLAMPMLESVRSLELTEGVWESLLTLVRQMPNLEHVTHSCLPLPFCLSFSRFLLFPCDHLPFLSFASAHSLVPLHHMTSVPVLCDDE